MKIAVVGAGAIGSVTGALLWEDGCNVTLIGRPKQVEAINTGGLILDGVPHGKRYDVPAKAVLDFKPDMVFLAVKSQDVLEACKTIAENAKGAIIVTMQNGVRSDEIASMVLGRERMFSSVVMFGATYIEDGRVDYNFPGGLMIGGAFPEASGPDLEILKSLLGGTFHVYVSDDIHGAHWTKLILNLNNAISGILGMTLQEVFSDTALCGLGVRVMQEGMAAVTCAGSSFADLPDLPAAKLKGLLDAPLDVSADIYGKIMVNLSQDPLPGSVLQSIQRGRPSEVDFLNGEIVTLGSTHGCATPLNEGLMLMVKEVEKTGKHIGKAALIGRLGAS